MTKRISGVTGRTNDRRNPGGPAGGGGWFGHRWWAVILALAVLGAIVRIVVIAETSSVPLIRHLIGDAAGYYAWGERIAAGAWLGEQAFYQAPLYPYVVGVLLATFGDGVWVIRVAQAVWGGAAVALMGVGAGRLFGRPVGVVAAVMLALYAPAIFFDGVVQKASLGCLLTCGLIAAIEWFRGRSCQWSVVSGQPSAADLVQSGDSPPPLLRKDGAPGPSAKEDPDGSRREAPLGPPLARGEALRVAGLAAGVLGMVCGLLALTRENALVWVPIVGGWVAWVTWAKARRSGGEASAVSGQPSGGEDPHSSESVAHRAGAGSMTRPTAWLRAAAAMALGVGVVLGPVSVRNRMVGGEWSLSTFQSGPNFFIGNSAEADGRYRPLVRGHESPAFERHDATILAERDKGRSLSAREVSDYWWSKALADIATDRWRWIRLMGRKLVMVWNRYEVADAESLYVYADWSETLRALGSVWHFGVLCPLAAVGAALTAGQWRRLWIYYALIVSMAMSVALFYVMARYRYPVAVLLIPFAAVGVVELWVRMRRGAMRSAGAGVVAGLIAAGVSHWPVHDESRLDALAWMNVGVALAREGDVVGATTYFRRAVDGHGASAEGNNNLAMALAVQGDYAGAIPHYERALRSEPGLMGAAYNLGVALERVGRLEEARAAYRRALAQDPTDADARSALERLK